MLLPRLDALMSLLDLEIEDILFPKRPEHRGSDPFTRRTLMNSKAGKGRSRLPKPDVTLPWMATKLGLDDGLADRFVYTFSTSTEANYSLWHSLFIGASIDGPPRLEIREAERLDTASRDLWPYLLSGDTQRLVSELESLDLPPTDIVRSTIIRLQTLNDNSPEALKRAVLPLVLSNMLYLMSCRDMGIGLVNHITPQFGDDSDIMPLNRWMDHFRELGGLQSDARLGEIFYPNWQPENSKREMARWRSGAFPKWKEIRTMARRAPDIDGRQDIYQTFGLIRLMHLIYSISGELEGQITGFSRRELFETLPQLQDYARSREASETVGTSDAAPEVEA